MNKMCKGAERCRNLHIYTHGCLCKIIFSAIFAIATTIPTFATNITDSNKGCTSGNLETSSGSTALEADWLANTVQVKYYSDDSQFETGSCQYDGTLTLPTTDPTKTGYTFAGWKVRATAPAQQCNLSNLDTSLAGTDYGQKQLLYAQYTSPSRNVEKYDLTQPGQWASEFDYGIIHGIAKCSPRQGNNNNFTWSNDSSNWSGTESDLTVSGVGKSCWCRIDKYTTDNTECTFSSSKFVYLIDDTSSDGWNCSVACAKWCSEYLIGNHATFTALRTALYSVTE